jgi:signal transduction histidine kinase/ligand-binding sensor domain-containing protein
MYIARTAILLACCIRALALDPWLDITQYAHTTWKVRDGFTKAEIHSVAQTTDGYLWLGTELGLFRFDGVRVMPWQPPGGQQLPSNYIGPLLVSRDGTLWIGTLKGLASWKNGKLTQHPEVMGTTIASLIEDRHGTAWFGTNEPSGVGRLCGIQGGRVECYGRGNFGLGITALYADDSGNLWVACSEGLWRWGPNSPQRYAFPRGVVEADSLIKDDNGELLLATNDGLKHLVEGRILPYSLPQVSGYFRPTSFLRSSDGSLWIGSQQGLLHSHQGRVDVFKAIDGLSGEFVGGVFEDREGDIWARTLGGLDRFRDVAVSTASRTPGLSNYGAHSVQGTPDGSIWIGTPDRLYRWKNDDVTVYRSRGALGRSRRSTAQALSANGHLTAIASSGLSGDVNSLGQDDRGRLWASTSEGVFYFENGRFVRVPGIPGEYTSSISGDGRDNLWIGNGDLGLFHWTGGGRVQHIPESRLQQRVVRTLVPDPQRDGVWVGFYEGGIAYIEGAEVRVSYDRADGIGSRVTHLRLDSHGTLWAATDAGLIRIRDSHVATLTTKNGLPCDEAHWSIEDEDHNIWLYMPCGLVRITRSELDAWASDLKRVVQFTSFDSSDGVRSVAVYGSYGPHVTKSLDGNLWFVQRDGVGVIDPKHLHFNQLPPPVHIEQVTADGKLYDVASGLRLPARVRNVAFNFVALSLVAPEKNRYRFMLEGWDRDWRAAVNDLRVEYSNLPPDHYKFLVSACNNSGVWNETGDTLEFSIAPAYYQTIWFRATDISAFFLVLWGLYRLRLHQIAREFNAQMEGRVDERLRVARDLHDTLLQSFQGLMPVFQTARNLLPGQSDRAAEVLDEGLHDAADAIVEGRNAIQNLRAKPSMDRDLGFLLNAAGQELAHSTEAEGSMPAFRVVVVGSRQPLTPLLQDEIYRIGREMLRNAFRHAHADRIEAEIRYERGLFRLRIRDDGKGIDSNVLKEGTRHGHWGLPGMHERAKSMGGRLKIWSEPGAGTEAELTVPARIAYEKFSTNNGWWTRLGRRLGLTAPNRGA